MLAVISVVMSVASTAQVNIAIHIGPPALPVYTQPVCPGDGYIWTPGYWAYDYDAGQYYWVPGTWILAPEPGFLWTPPWWGWNGVAFVFHDGYWGPHVGFYGGINYGFGYFGNGFEGGRWDNGRFFYNRSVTNVNVVNIHNTYNTTVVRNVTVNRVSYNGGAGGLTVRPTAEEKRYDSERHVEAVASQREHIQAAREDRSLRASENHGKPPIAATDRPGAFHGNVEAAREAGEPYRGGKGVPRPPAPNDAKDLRRPTFTPPNTGNAKLDQKYQKQQEKLGNREEKEHQKLAAQQQREHQQAEKQHADDAARQQMEQRHQQQTQAMEDRHAQQQQRLQERQQPRKK